MLLEIKNVTKNFDGLKAVDDFSCSIEKGKIVGLIGANGAGKTTLFNIITAFLNSGDGKILFDGKEITGKPPYKINQIGISRTFQDLRLIQHMTVLENVLLFFKNQPGERLANIFLKNKTCDTIEKKNIEKAIEFLHFAGIDNKASDLAENLSYGQQKLLSIICCLASEPKLLLLDEPVSGVQPAMIVKIENILHTLAERDNTTILFIEHDIDFVMRISDTIIVMDAGKKIAEVEPSLIKNNKEILEAYLS